MRFTSYGESHGEVIGGVLDGFPANFELDLQKVQQQLDRRRPGQSAYTTQRKEEDILHVNSGLFEGKTLGSPIHFYVKNKDSKPEDYDHLKEVYRPSHADYTYEKKYGHRDHRGGGRSSARVTAAWVAAGAMAEQYLAQKYGVYIGAYVHAIGSENYDGEAQFFIKEEVDKNVLRCPFPEIAERMEKQIEAAKEKKDSLGGVIQLVIKGLPAGVGDPVFDKLSAKLGHAMLNINAVKGFEIGGGFNMATKYGSEVNDAFVQENGKITTNTNFSGGLQGGISNGMDILCKIAFKPTATIGSDQATLNKDMENVKFEGKGRHDPCVVPRAVPIVEAMAALVLLDAILPTGA